MFSVEIPRKLFSTLRSTYVLESMASLLCEFLNFSIAAGGVLSHSEMSSSKLCRSRSGEELLRQLQN